MVKKVLLLTALTVALLSAIFFSSATAWTGTYHLEKQWIKIWINPDGTIDLFYNITLALDSGEPITPTIPIKVGQPNADFTIENAKDQYGNTLTATPLIQGTDYKVQINLHSTLHPGEKIWFTLLTKVANMIYNDSAMNPGNLGMLFTPCWWPATVQDLRVAIVLPSGVTSDMVKTYRIWTSNSTENGLTVIYWQKQNLSLNEQYSVGVSFPQEYMPDYVPPEVTPPPDGYTPPSISPGLFTGLITIFFILGAAVFTVFIGAYARKQQYFSPSISMETLGIRRGLTAVEASYLLEMKPTQIVTEILYTSLKKRAIWVNAVKPSLKLRIMPKFESSMERKELLRYYETDFLNAVKSEGTLDEVKLAQTIMTLRDTVEEKMHGYCRRDTVAYYKNIVAKAWQQVEQAGTPELASNAYDEQLLWLLLDPNIKTRTQTVFLQQNFAPNPAWFWYWYGYQHYHPHPTYTSKIEMPTQVPQLPAIPGAEFASNIATSLEQTANNIVINLEKFANAIIPTQPAKSSHEPVHHGATCVCACHACACACACVSCACACASGGVG
jgi:hypothetical protein